MSDRHRTEPLAPSHVRDAFDCGSEPLNRYIRQQATQDVRRKISNCFVVAHGGKVVAYYTLAATGILASDLPADVVKRLPKYPLIPGGLIGRLAVDVSAQGDRLGSSLLIDAALRAHAAEPAIHSLVVEAKDERAIAFYATFGFRSFSSAPHRLFLPVATAISAYQAQPLSRSDS